MYSLITMATLRSLPQGI